CQIHYDAQLAGGGSKHLSLSVDDDGVMRKQDFPALQYLSRGPLWRVARPARLPASRDMSVKTLEDTPFYTRSQVCVDGREFMHESLDLRRFCLPWVQFLLPFRMPRVT
ncbi:MAG: carotenoid 1,2-hydratase, partial [Halieaceae bacterium]|nr:carotenoid 1,2-hydratase [Halieaceae bacterium]